LQGCRSPPVCCNKLARRRERDGFVADGSAGDEVESVPGLARQAVAPRARQLFADFPGPNAVALATPVHGEDHFPLVGTYTENLACKTDGSDAGVSRVTITPRDIDSVFGLCTILSKKREGATFVVHVECKGPGGSQMLSDVNLTPREDKTIDFSDQDQTYKAVLHRCPD
jgi:hypothetical protein